MSDNQPKMETRIWRGTCRSCAWYRRSTYECRRPDMPVAALRGYTEENCKDHSRTEKIIIDILK